jgi:hypothetical protein
MPKGERILAQSKRIAPPPSFKKSFQIGILMCLIYLKLVFSKLGKTLLNTKRRTSFRESFV